MTLLDAISQMLAVPEQFRHAKLIIAWGANIHGNNIHLWPFIEEARRAGAKLIVIDPYRTRTAALADEHLAINPSADRHRYAVPFFFAPNIYWPIRCVPSCCDAGNPPRYP